MKKLISTIIVVGMLLGAVGGCAAPSKKIYATWDPPTEGSPVVSYVIEKLDKNGNWRRVSGKYISPTTIEFRENVGNIVIVRVAGVDAEGRQGPWSKNSDPFEVPE